MSFPSHYEITVSGENGHMFTTSPTSIQNRIDLKNIYDLFVVKFPESEGYSITVTHWQCSGHSIEGYPFIHKTGVNNHG